MEIISRFAKEDFQLWDHVYGKDVIKQLELTQVGVAPIVISLEESMLMWFQKWEPGKRERERRLKKALAEAAANPEPPPSETLDKGFASIPEGKTWLVLNGFTNSNYLHF